MKQDASATKMAVQATLHCLSGCAVGEVLGTVVGSGLGWNNIMTEIFTVLLAFMFGYGLTVRSLLHNHLSFARAGRLALASDTLSITSMEIVDTAIILLVPGALAAGPTTRLFWLSLGLSLVSAFIVAVPVNRALIRRGKGHALVHGVHQHSA